MSRMIRMNPRHHTNHTNCFVFDLDYGYATVVDVFDSCLYFANSFAFDHSDLSNGHVSKIDFESGDRDALWIDSAIVFSKPALSENH